MYDGGHKLWVGPHRSMFMQGRRRHGADGITAVFPLKKNLARSIGWGPWPGAWDPLITFLKKHVNILKFFITDALL